MARCRSNGPGALTCELPEGHSGNHGAEDPDTDDGSFVWWEAR